jgi:selenocysteine lyase/cysteine desulfurase
MSVLPNTSLCGENAAPAVRSRPLHVVPASPDLPAVVGADLVVPTLSGQATYANLDHAASTPALVRVKEAVDRALETYASVHRGAGYASRLTSAWYEQARAEVASFVGARADDTVVFTRTTTDSWNLLSHTLPSRTTVFVFGTEHHSTLLPWGRYRTVRLPIPRTVDDAHALLDEALSEHQARHRLVVIAGASNVTGEVWPVEQFTQLAHSHGARIAVDAAQLSAHRTLDVAGWDVDYLAFSGHKTYAPFGAGVLVGHSDWLDAGAPYLYGGGATASVSESGTTWATGAARHEGGSPNVIGAIALAAACATIRDNRAAIEAHEQALLARLREGLEQVPGLELLSIFDDDHDRVGVLAFTIDGWESGLISQVLSVEHGIGVRDGKFCAHLLVDELLEDPWSERASTAVRASIGLGTTAEAVDRLVGAVQRLVAEGPEATWRRTDRGWVIDGTDPRDVEVTRPW